MKKYIASWVILCLVWMAAPAYGQSLSRFGNKNVKVGDWVDQQFRKGTTPPFSFRYNGNHSSDFIGKWQFTAKKGGQNAQGVVNNIYSWQDRKTGLNVTCDLKYYPEYEAVEWVLHFTNGSGADSPLITRYGLEVRR